VLNTTLFGECSSLKAPKAASDCSERRRLGLAAY